MRFAALAALLGLSCCAVVCTAQTAAVAPPEAVRPDERYAALAVRGEASGLEWDANFQQLCREVLARAEAGSRLDDEARALFAGMLTWMQRRGGRPRLQNRYDWAQHFTSGGALQGYLDAGWLAGVRKEQHDATQPGNAFDLDDLAATMYGARWIELACSKTPGTGRAWVQSWADAKMSLEKSIPKLTYGRLPPSANATPEQIRSLLEDVQRNWK